MNHARPRATWRSAVAAVVVIASVGAVAWFLNAPSAPALAAAQTYATDPSCDADLTRAARAQRVPQPDAYGTAQRATPCWIVDGTSVGVLDMSTALATVPSPRIPVSVMVFARVPSSRMPMESLTIADANASQFARSAERGQSLRLQYFRSVAARVEANGITVRTASAPDVVVDRARERARNAALAGITALLAAAFFVYTVARIVQRAKRTLLMGVSEPARRADTVPRRRTGRRRVP